MYIITKKLQNDAPVKLHRVDLIFMWNNQVFIRWQGLCLLPHPSHTNPLPYKLRFNWSFILKCVSVGEKSQWRIYRMGLDGLGPTPQKKKWQKEEKPSGQVKRNRSPP